MTATIQTPVKQTTANKGIAAPTFPDGTTVSCLIVPTTARLNRSLFGGMQVGSFTGYFHRDTTISAECRVKISAAEIYRVVTLIDLSTLGRAHKVADLEKMNSL